MFGNLEVPGTLSKDIFHGNGGIITVVASAVDHWFIKGKEKFKTVSGVGEEHPRGNGRKSR